MPPWLTRRGPSDRDALARKQREHGGSGAGRGPDAVAGCRPGKSLAPITGIEFQPARCLWGSACAWQPSGGRTPEIGPCDHPTGLPTVSAVAETVADVLCANARAAVRDWTGINGVPIVADAFDTLRVQFVDEEQTVPVDAGAWSELVANPPRRIGQMLMST
jgi:hypothetical protein